MRAALISRAFWNSHSPSAADSRCAAGRRSRCARARTACADGQADPPIAVHPGKLEVRDLLAVALVERKMAVVRRAGACRRRAPAGRRIGADRALAIGVGAVDLRGVPPMRLVVAVGRRAGPGPPGRAGRPATCAGCCIVGSRPVVAGRQRQAMRLLVVSSAAVTEPVVHHELQPGRDQHVEVRDRHEIATRQQRAADQARIGLVESGGCSPIGIGDAARCGRSARRPCPSTGNRDRCSCRRSCADRGARRRRSDGAATDRAPYPGGYARAC